jgi:hypothetical protein
LQIFRALSYIHRCIGVCHRDIKPQNLLVWPLFYCAYALLQIFVLILLSGKYLLNAFLCRSIHTPTRLNYVTLEVQKFWYVKCMSASPFISFTSTSVVWVRW